MPGRNVDSDYRQRRRSGGGDPEDIGNPRARQAARAAAAAVTVTTTDNVSTLLNQGVDIKDIPTTITPGAVLPTTVPTFGGGQTTAPTSGGTSGAGGTPFNLGRFMENWTSQNDAGGVGVPIAGPMGATTTGGGVNPTDMLNRLTKDTFTPGTTPGATYSYTQQQPQNQTMDIYYHYYPQEIINRNIQEIKYGPQNIYYHGQPGGGGGGGGGGGTKQRSAAVSRLMQWRL